MDLPSHELQAFAMVAQTLNFSTAAERVHITQPALTQRIQSLERTLGLTLLIRDRRGIRLTEAGLRLLRYCKLKEHLEGELLADLGAASNERGLAGTLRIAGYSSVLKSVIMPALASLLRENPNIGFEFSVHEMRDLYSVLERGEADFVLLDHAIQRNNVVTVVLGQERYVLVRGREHACPDVFLDHDLDDRLTENFLSLQGAVPKNFRRCYVDDIEGTMQGIALGLGQGVVPKHLLRDHMPIKVVKSKVALNRPVTLHYFQQSYYSNLQKQTVQALRQNAARYL